MKQLFLIPYNLINEQKKNVEPDIFTEKNEAKKFQLQSLIFSRDCPFL